jgi:hypothetical protein
MFTAPLTQESLDEALSFNSWADINE